MDTSNAPIWNSAAQPEYVTAVRAIWADLTDAERDLFFATYAVVDRKLADRNLDLATVIGLAVVECSG